ncbi:Glutaredoxin (GrxC) (PDB:1AAZ) [Commensalibacter communis]|uniref:Glutaredoxin n=1 Tax=Commensalibacter communis TaxID=2972786 RepID=A0A9W4TN54_9PROT|nr:glutaredoxin 3 [Commensalibacter communis]CAI3954443.1 Glutaredoxin (GrxC) (PDB:1AAZ) [Commensalibacter communis]CAI3955709.1 Glutaredoxin (GrxC) (PDB:1AAZ) [Commensalibacter communis]CAI3956071.1 Glutaredoxin (GrxC) (PDB:1AAZ) [Commensalibacter communis]CAI3956597.1 Glutaredoxin (GrxC) (PDB:1AAZ) [Commensalibacter communis]CAI3956689.1 Glutaredoxin (GrxC) (PDB:1AAZ) [Commensalibacter communis]
MAKVEIYTQPGCPYCQKALMLLQAKNADFQEISAPKGTPQREEAINRSGGKTTVPQIFIDGKAIGGCDDLMALNQSGELQKLLAV